MDTKDKKRRRPAAETDRARPAGPSRKPRPAQEPERSARKKKPAAQQRRKTPATQRPPRKAPEPMEIPEVTYSMPKPLSRGQFVLKLCSVLAVVLALIACLSLFFRVDSITIAGAEKYSPYTVETASGIERGDSLLGISEPRAAGRIIDELPYVDQVRIVRHLPGSVEIMIRELDVTYAIEAYDGSWWLIAADGRVIEQIDESAVGGYTRITGVLADAPAVGETVRASASQEESGESEEDSDLSRELADTRLQVLLTILTELERNEVIGRMAGVDVSDLSALSMEYGSRFHVILGDGERLPEKIAMMTAAAAQLEEYEIGELDVSFQFSDTVIFKPES